MRFWLYVNNNKHSFVEGERLPAFGETVAYKNEFTSSLEEAVVRDVKTEVLGGKSDIGHPVHMIYHVYTKTEQ